MNMTEFERLVQAGYRYIPVFSQRLADTDTPVSVFARLRAQAEPAHRARYLFESVHGGERWGRYSIVGLGNGTVFQCRGGVIQIQHADGAQESVQTTDPFAFIRDFQSAFQVPPANEVPALPKFTGGLVGYFGYDTVRYIEPRLSHVPEADPIGLPDFWFMVSDTVVVFDNLRDTLSIITHADSREPNAYTEAQARLQAVEAALALPVSLKAVPHTAPVFVSHSGDEKFKTDVTRIQEYIKAGDVMQVVPSQRMSSPFDGDPLSVYRALRHLNPSPYMFLVDGETLADKAGESKAFHLVGSSPEILTRLEGDTVTVRPLAGTRPRGKTPEEEAALEADLLADGKEIAEHLMLIDLGRNDVGRVSQIGKVRVTEQMVIEKYSHVMHIVSNVEGKVRPELDALDVFKATFPAGTLSGAPKIRAMEIIDELEPVKRGVFGGAVGYLGWHGEMDMAIAIRTAVIAGGQVHVQAGAGVVADSVPASEWNETLIKARAVIKAVELSANGLVF